MNLLIDGDLVAFRCAATAEQEECSIAIARTNEFMEKLLAETSATEYETFLSGSKNFRYTIFPEYKANRIGKYRPRWEKECKNFLREEWQAHSEETLEADDLLAIRQTELKDTSIICSIDKDLKQVPGWHYHWEQTRLGKVVAEAKLFYVNEHEALLHFYTQLIIGDTADGIKGVVGAGKKAAAVLENCVTEEEMFNIVREMYSCDEEMLMNGQVLYMLRERDKLWEFPIELE